MENRRACHWCAQRWPKRERGPAFLAVAASAGIVAGIHSAHGSAAGHGKGVWACNITSKWCSDQGQKARDRLEDGVASIGLHDPQVAPAWDSEETSARADDKELHERQCPKWKWNASRTVRTRSMRSWKSCKTRTTYRCAFTSLAWRTFCWSSCMDSSASASSRRARDGSP